MKIGLIGGGKMSEALIKAALGTGVAEASGIFVSDVSAERREFLSRRYDVNVETDNSAVVSQARIVILAVKPQNLDEVLDEVASMIGADHLCLSIVAGKKLSYLEERLPNARVVRVMPNLACSVGEGVCAYCPGTRATEEDLVSVSAILVSCGRAVRLPDKDFDAVTALSGSGPAFFAYCLAALVDGAVKEGLPETEALILAEQTMRGTARILMEGGLKPRQLIDAVSSARGTTWAGFKVLGPSDVADVLAQTISAAAARSRELSNGEG